MAKGWLPPLSPYSLLQDSLTPNEWLVLLSCILLNMTTRTQVDRVLPKLLERWPDPVSMSRADKEELCEIISPLGLCRRRTVTIIKFCEAYVQGVDRIIDLPGIGEYGDACHRIFCRGLVDPSEPRDHALRYVHRWLVRRRESCP